MINYNGDQWFDAGRIFATLNNPFHGRVARLIVEIHLMISRLGMLELLGPAHLIFLAILRSLNWN